MMKRLLYLLIIPFMFYSCSENELEGPAVENSDATYLDVAEADYIGIMQTTTSIDNWSNLYKYKASNGKMQKKKVGLLDGSGNPVDSSLISIQVSNIIPVSENYEIYTGSFEFIGNDEEVVNYNSILVRLSDGAIFDLGYFPRNADIFYNKEFLPKDKAGNRYFISGYGIYKIANLREGEPVIEGLFENNQWEIDRFFVAPDGTLFFKEHVSNTTKARTPEGKFITTDLNLFNFFATSDGQVHAFSEQGLLTLTINENRIENSIVYDDFIIRESEYFYQSNGNFFFFEKGTKGSDYSIGFVFNEKEGTGNPVIFRDRENNTTSLCGINENVIWTCSNVYEELPLESFRSYDLNTFKVEDFLLESDTLFFNTPSGVDTVIQSQTAMAAIIDPGVEIEVPDNLEVYSYTFSNDGVVFTGFDLNDGTTISAILRQNGELMIIEKQALAGTMNILERVN